LLNICTNIDVVSKRKLSSVVLAECKNIFHDGTVIAQLSVVIESNVRSIVVNRITASIGQYTVKTIKLFTLLSGVVKTSQYIYKSDGYMHARLYYSVRF